jgi:hypothetical protein
MQVAFTVNGKPINVEIEPCTGDRENDPTARKTFRKKLWRVTWRGSTCRAPVLKFAAECCGASQPVPNDIHSQRFLYSRRATFSLLRAIASRLIATRSVACRTSSWQAMQRSSEALI